ncbi:MAG: hydantoinase/oxoprolinase family protein [Halobacteria archaeon]
MFLGVDAGGTNLDVVLADRQGIISTYKMSGDLGDGFVDAVEETAGEVLSELERVVVASTRVLNADVQDRLPDCTNVLVPGVGLSPELGFQGERNVVVDGCIDHRGRETEEVDEEKLTSLDTETATAAVTAKFGVRNPETENEAREQLERSGKFEAISIGHAATGTPGFPSRAGTAVANAKAMPTFREVADAVESGVDHLDVDARVYFLKGDGGTVTSEHGREAPGYTVGGGPSASTMGLLALMRREDLDSEDALLVDVGGTTTDITAVRDGNPVMGSGSTIDGIETRYNAADSLDLPYGGDTAVGDDGLTRYREGNAAAFGGEVPTLTDALNDAERLDIGDMGKSREALECLAVDPSDVFEEYYDAMSTAVENFVARLDFSPSRMVLGGVLAEAVSEGIARNLDFITEAVVPEYADVAGAVGCAASRPSVRTDVYVDTARAQISVTPGGVEATVERGEEFTSSEARKLVERCAVAASVGGNVDDERASGYSDGVSSEPNVEMQEFENYNVVQKSRKRGEIIDAAAQKEPGLADYVESWGES